MPQLIRRVLVTGAASGIGHAIAQAFRMDGWHVCGLDRSPAPKDSKAHEWVICDLSEDDALKKSLEALTRHAWSAVVSCAGVAGVESIQRVLKINFFAVRRMITALKPAISTNGAVILISSGAGMKWMEKREVLRPILDASDEAALALAAALCESPAHAYVLSKELLSFYGAYACLQDSARGVRMNVVSPGGVRTPLIADFTQSMGSAAMDFSLSVTGRHAEPDEIASAAVFLASPQASWINGAELRVDGGLTGALNAGIVDFPAWR